MRQNCRCPKGLAAKPSSALSKAQSPLPAQVSLAGSPTNSKALRTSCCAPPLRGSPSSTLPRFLLAPAGFAVQTIDTSTSLEVLQPALEDETLLDEIADDMGHHLMHFLNDRSVSVRAD